MDHNDIQAAISSFIDFGGKVFKCGRDPREKYTATRNFYVQGISRAIGSLSVDSFVSSTPDMRSMDVQDDGKLLFINII